MKETINKKSEAKELFVEMLNSLMRAVIRKVEPNPDSSSSGCGYVPNPYASEDPAKIDENWKKEDEDQIFVLLGCYYDPDEYFVDDQFIAISHSSECLEEHARKLGAIHIYRDGDEVPDDENYHYQRRRFRIVRVGILK